MSVTMSSVYSHNGLAYEMRVTQSGKRPQDKGVEIEYLGDDKAAPFTLSAYWNDVKEVWDVKVEFRPRIAHDSLNLRSYVEDVQIGVEMVTEFREILNAE